MFGVCFWKFWYPKNTIIKDPPQKRRWINTGDSRHTRTSQNCWSNSLWPLGFIHFNTTRPQSGPKSTSKPLQSNGLSARGPKAKALTLASRICGRPKQTNQPTNQPTSSTTNWSNQPINQTSKEGSYRGMPFGSFKRDPCRSSLGVLLALSGMVFVVCSDVLVKCFSNSFECLQLCLIFVPGVIWSF